ncbi:MAG TPA: NAD(P)-binding domain-containing protein [Solirubrobacteraceae bacterium]|nr:NAD(P)-binding domain-containing protein [Solirubrobacteraceae bacterium]
MRSVSFIGYGEFAHALAGGLREAGVDLQAYVRPRGDVAAADVRRDRMRSAGVRPAESPGAAVTGADVVIAAVPASSAGSVAEACAPHLESGQLYVDPSSSLPIAKRHAAELVERAGAAYVDAAVLGTVVTAGAGVPMLAAGSGAARWSDEASAVGLNVTAIAGAAGDAALVKLLRSVYMKGRDALVLEMLLAARRHGVHEAVLASIGGAGEQVAFPSLAERVMCSLAVYAERRADELADAASLVRDVGVEPLMAEAGETRLRLLAESGVRSRFGGERPRDLAEVLSCLEALESERSDVATAG